MIRSTIGFISGALVLAVLAAPKARGESFATEFSAFAGTASPGNMSGGAGGGYFEGSSGYGFGDSSMGASWDCTNASNCSYPLVEVLFMYTAATSVDITSVFLETPLNSAPSSSTPGNCAVIGSAGTLTLGALSAAGSASLADIFCTTSTPFGDNTPYSVFLQTGAVIDPDVADITGTTSLEELNVGTAASSAVPEPSSVVLGLTVLGLAASRRLWR